MTITSDLQLVSKVQVGASAEYAVVGIRTSNSITSPANQTRASYEEIRWDLTCLAEIAAPTSITALNETLKSELASVGLAVLLTALGGVRTMPAAGIDGSMRGYPRVEISDIPAESFANFQAFTLTAITRVPIVDGSGIVEHTTETETITNADGTIETSLRGEIRLADNVDAAAWINTNVFAPVRAAADLTGNAVVTRVGVTDDTSHAKYSYTVKPGISGVAGVTDASVDDRTTKDVTGRRVRTISGYAEGTSASTFAAAQRIAELPNLKLLREDGPSTPSVPGGRVNFNYQYVAGMSDVRFPNIFITRFTETIDKVGGGSQINSASFLTGNPILRKGLQLPAVYRQSTQIEFIGAISAHGLTPLMATANMNGSPREKMTSAGDLHTVSMDWSYIFETAVPMPAPRTVNGVA